jgi:hypothetical protein
MAKNAGDFPANSPETRKSSSHSASAITETEASVPMTRPLMVGSFSIDDAIGMHLVDCDQCRNAIVHLRPVGLGMKSGLCDAYFQLQLMRADYEGKVNGITAHTEYGDEAPIQGRLQ